MRTSIYFRQKPIMESSPKRAFGGMVEFQRGEVLIRSLRNGRVIRSANMEEAEIWTRGKKEERHGVHLKYE